MKKLYIEMADDSLKREIGLMDRKHLSSNSGMLFKFPSIKRLSFWMKNTYIPLDIAFISDDGKIMQINEMTPLSTRAITSRHPCRYALEVNKGWFEENNVDIGSSVLGFGIRKMAQVMPFEPMSPEVMPQEQPPPTPPADIILNKTHKEIFDDANLKGKNLIIIYMTKKGKVLPPKSISPPFTFEEDAEGSPNALVKVWDNQSSGWKSFLLDNILNLDFEEESK